MVSYRNIGVRSMLQGTTRLTSTDVLKFLSDRTIYVFNPETRLLVATVEYQADGACCASFVEGKSDKGTWGMEDDSYWTRYLEFRNGEKNSFYLQWVSDDVVQAYHTDGSRAYLQSGSPTL
jgi:hypothetical protein